MNINSFFSQLCLPTCGLQVLTYLQRQHHRDSYWPSNVVEFCKDLRILYFPGD
jgi:hypothetical protein